MTLHQVDFSNGAIWHFNTRGKGRDQFHHVAINILITNVAVLRKLSYLSSYYNLLRFEWQSKKQPNINIIRSEYKVQTKLTNHRRHFGLAESAPRHVKFPVITKFLVVYWAIASTVIPQQRQFKQISVHCLPPLWGNNHQMITLFHLSRFNRSPWC